MPPTLGSADLQRLVNRLRGQQAFVEPADLGALEPGIPCGAAGQVLRGDKVWADIPTVLGYTPAPLGVDGKVPAEYLPAAGGGPASTDALGEGSTNLYFTAARVRAVVLTGLSTATSAAIAATDSVLAALGKLQAQVSAKADASSLTGKLDTSHAGSGGTAHAVAGVAAGFMSAADKTKLDGIASGATANSTDVQLRDRATHTGTQALSTISGLGTGVAAFLATPTSANMAGMLADETGTGSNVFSTAPDLTSVKLLGTTYMQQGAPTSKAAAATLTIAELLTGIVQYTGAAATLTLPTGALIDAGVLAGLAVDRAFEFVVINTGNGAATLATSTGLTLVGSMVVTNGTSARFRVRKTAASTFTVYRV